MSFARPSTPTLIERAIADIENRLPGADARLRRSNLNALARVNAGAAHGLYGHLDWLARQILPDTAEAEILERHAAIWLTTGRVPASYASGRATITGSSGVTIPDGTLYKRADGASYATSAEAVITGGVATVSLIATQLGQAGNADAGIALRLDSPIAGVDASATVTTAAITGGADAETDDSLRARLLERIKEPPMGGAKHDYIAWALEVPGVTRAWCYPEEMGDGTVTVRFVRDNDASLIPDEAEIAAVQAHIDAVRPVTSHLYVVAPIPVPIHFEVQLVPETLAVKAAVEAELRDLLAREAVPEGGAGEGKILVSHIREAISIASGEYDHNLAFPITSVVLGLGQMAVFGSLTFVKPALVL
jgi:uncharacterized phage protein gp47/JayE